MIQDWTILNRKRIADFKIFQIEKKQVRSPRTGDIRDIQAIRSPGWVLVLGLTPEEEAVMVRQYRHGTKIETKEINHGMVLLAFFFFWMKHSKFAQTQ